MYFGDPIMTPKQWAVGVGIGAVTGGVVNGSLALANNKTFLRGDLKFRPAPVHMSPLTPKGFQKVGEGIEIAPPKGGDSCCI
jgi:hypothetical protein